jgi:hypothetical protein
MTPILLVVITAAGVFLASLIILIRMSLADRKARRRWQEEGVDGNL